MLANAGSRWHDGGSAESCKEEAATLGAPMSLPCGDDCADCEIPAAASMLSQLNEGTDIVEATTAGGEVPSPIGEETT